jgi:sugar phosphate isomerase/epimerase
MCKLICYLTALTLGLGGAAWAQHDDPDTFEPEFYAFQNGVSFGSFENEAKTLKELGFDGISQVNAGGEKLAERISEYDKVGLRVLSIYLNVDDKPIDADVVKPFKSRGSLIELTIRKMTSNTVEAVRQTAEMAASMKIRVALYPHHGFAVATMPQALDLIAKVNHRNLGVMFNLCHFLKNEKAEDLESVLEKAGSHLFAVSTSGANLGGAGWGDLIKPLDQGNFPQARLYGVLKKLKFKGPVGLQCYGVRGDKRTNLKNSIAAWKKIVTEL